MLLTSLTCQLSDRQTVIYKLAVVIFFHYYYCCCCWCCYCCNMQHHWRTSTSWSTSVIMQHACGVIMWQKLANFLATSRQPIKQKKVKEKKKEQNFLHLRLAVLCWYSPHHVRCLFNVTTGLYNLLPPTFVICVRAAYIVYRTSSSQNTTSNSYHYTTLTTTGTQKKKWNWKRIRKTGKFHCSLFDFVFVRLWVQGVNGVKTTKYSGSAWKNYREI